MITMIRNWFEMDMDSYKSIWQVGQRYYFISSVRSNYICETMAFECDENEQVKSWIEVWEGPYDVDHADVAKELAA